MKILKNPYRHDTTTVRGLESVPCPSVTAGRPSELIEKCPEYGSTPLSQSSALAQQIGAAELWLKDERGRMGLGSFKALGAAYVIADLAASRKDISDMTFVTASAGNHGLSVAAGAKVFGATAIIYLAETVPASFADRLRKMGATVRQEGTDYQASMDAAAAAAKTEGLTLLSDSSWDGYTDLPHRLMEGYLVMAAECERQMQTAPTHIMLQAGVGGMAGAVAAYVRHVWGDNPTITVVEPTAAPALQQSISAGQSVYANGPDSSMGRLDCKEPSLIALKGLSNDADYFVTVSDEFVEQHLPALSDAGYATSPSGGAAVVALFDPEIRAAIGVGPDSRVLAIISEGPDQ